MIHAYAATEQDELPAPGNQGQAWGRYILPAHVPAKQSCRVASAIRGNYTEIA